MIDLGLSIEADRCPVRTGEFMGRGFLLSIPSPVVREMGIEIEANDRLRRVCRGRGRAPSSVAVPLIAMGGSEGVEVDMSK